LGLWPIKEITAMKIAYLMDPLESIQPENETTSHLMYESNQRGHQVYFLEPHDVYIRSDQVVARMRNISVERRPRTWRNTGRSDHTAARQT
jgi:glutathione synthase/RimK-type ligase-like ATP-grasp enzyme